MPVILAPLILPVALIVPDIFAPVPVTVNVELPTAVKVTFPLAVAIFTLLFPLLMPEPTGTAAQVNVPEPFVCR